MIVRACSHSKYDHKMHKRAQRGAKKLGLTTYDWYSWRGYSLPDAIELAYELHKPGDRGFNPERAAAIMEMAQKDLEDAIPKAFAAKLLGFNTPTFRKGTYYKDDAKELPFDHHPRAGFYPWIRTALTTRTEIKELIDSGKYKLHV